PTAISKGPERPASAAPRRAPEPGDLPRADSISLISLAKFGCFSYASADWRRPGACVAETFIASASRPSGRGNHAAADYFRGRHRLQQLQAGPAERDAAGP